VWSAWHKAAELYLGAGLAMYRAPGGAAQVLEHGPGIPVARVLQLLDEMIPTSTPDSPKRPPVQVSLGAAYCPAVSLSLPEGLKGPAEVQALALGACTQAMQCAPDELNVCVDWSAGRVAAAVPKAVLGALQAWAREHRTRLASVAPLWADATRSPAVQSIRTRASIVYEPGAVTLLASEGDAPSFSSIAEDADAARQLASRWTAGLALDDSAVASIRFHPQERGAWPHGPRAWAGHWSTQ
jgi:hypothetical protein